MNNFHKAIRCDFCGQFDIVGTRYACLVCTNYDQCETCFSTKQVSLNHKPYHPVQAILPDNELTASIFSVAPEQVRVYCCPYCGDKDFNGNGLVQHCRRFHPDGGHPVRCPVCLVTDQPYSLHLSVPLLKHLLERHGEYGCDGSNGQLQSSSQEEAECSICREYLQAGDGQTRYLQCVHGFHNSCITRWLEDNSNCPVCRTEV